MRMRLFVMLAAISAALAPIVAAQTPASPPAPVETLTPCNLPVYVVANAAGVSIGAYAGRTAILVDPSAYKAAGGEWRAKASALCAAYTEARTASGSREARKEGGPGVADILSEKSGGGGGAGGKIKPDPRPPVPPPAPAPSRPTIAGEVVTTRSADATGAGVALPKDYEIVSNVLLPGESYLPKSDGMPTGVVLLDRTQRAKNESLCKALLGARTRTVRTEEAARRENPNGDFLVTHWLSRGGVIDEGDCAELLAKYDFTRSEGVRQTYGLKASKGPIFLALDPSGEMMFLDLEDASADEVFAATSDWMALALKAPQSGPNAGKPPPGLIASANRLFARVAAGFSSLAGAATPTTVVFNDPIRGATRTFNIYRAGRYLIGATFRL